MAFLTEAIFVSYLPHFNPALILGNGFSGISNQQKTLLPGSVFNF